NAHECVHDKRTEVFQSRTHQLDHEPLIIPIHDERGDAVAFAVDEPKCAGLVFEPGATCDRSLEFFLPPYCVDGGVWIRLEESKRDLRLGTPESNAERLASLIVDPN